MHAVQKKFQDELEYDLLTEKQKVQLRIDKGDAEFRRVMRNNKIYPKRGHFNITEMKPSNKPLINVAG